jgi:hypothetical protein
MINIWGISTWGSGTYDQMTRWDLSCPFFISGGIRRIEGAEKCCANCAYWHVYDEHLFKDNNE